MKKIAVLGAGNGGHAVSADLTLRGYEVSLYEMPQFASNIKKILETKTITLTSQEMKGGVAKLANVTTNIDEAIEGAELIIIIVPAYGHKGYAELLAKRVKDSQTILLMPGTFGALEMKKVFMENGETRNLTIAECNTIPFATRITEPGKVAVFAKKNYFRIGVFPSNRTDEVMKKLDNLYPFAPCKNVLECGLSSLNPVGHVAPVLLNIGRIEYVAKTPFFLYEQGFTPATTKIIETVNDEVIAIGNKLGLKIERLEEAVYKAGYGPKGTLMQTVKGSSTLTKVGGPNTSDTRYLKEDTPLGLVPYALLGKKLGVPTPTIDSLIHLVSTIFDVDYLKTGRTLENLGIDKMSEGELKVFVEEGK